MMDSGFSLNTMSGNDIGEIILYALSTCSWCQKVRNLLEKKGLRYEYVYVDLLSDLENLHISQEIEKWNPDLSFPTLVLDNTDCIIGFNEQAILDWIEKKQNIKNLPK